MQRVPDGAESVSQAVRALRHRNFRLFLAGQVISLAGTWMQQVALSWLVYRLTRSMRVEPRRGGGGERRPVLTELKDGLRYAFGFAPIRSLLLLIGVVSVMGVPFTVLMPVFATVVLHGGAHTLGLLMSSLGMGALVGALFLAARRSVRGLGRVILAAVILFGLSLVGFGLSRNKWLSMALLVAAGLGMMVHMAASNTILQTIVDEDKRGRVMSFYAMAFMGSLPLGSLLSGALAARIGAPATVMLGGIACLFAAGFARVLPSLRAQVRPIYARLGVIPEVAAGLQTAAELTAPPRD